MVGQIQFNKCIAAQYILDKSKVFGLSYAQLFQLLVRVGGLDNLLSRCDLRSALEDFFLYRFSFRDTARYAALVDKSFDFQLRVLSYGDLDYPIELKLLSYPPLFLFVLGDFFLGSSLTVVGSRVHSSYGAGLTRKICAVAVEQELTVVSGFAKGIDRLAHESTLDFGGRTIGVLGCGVDYCYPKENFSLYSRMLKEGCFISEYGLGTRPQKWHFPQRNRLLSALSQSTIVVEAGLKSGALITATYAAEQGKTVYAVPGPIDSPYSQGCNRLIQDGALVLEKPDGFIKI